MKVNTKHIIAYTAIILVLAVLLQTTPVFFPALSVIALGPINILQLISGILVSMCLLIATWNAGLLSGISIAIILPLATLPFTQNPLLETPSALVLIVGNILFCLIAWIPYATDLTRIALTVIAAFVKFGSAALLFAYILPLFIPDSSTTANITMLVSALIGGLLAFALAPKLPRLTI